MVKGLKRIFKLLVSCSLGVLFLFFILSLREQTLTGRHVMITVGLSISSILALLALILFILSLAIPRGIEKAKWYKEAITKAEKLAKKMMEKYSHRVKRANIGEKALKEAYNISQELAEKFNTSPEPIFKAITYELEETELKSAIDAYRRR